MNTPNEMNQPVPPTNAKLTHAILINGHRVPVAVQNHQGDMLLYTAVDLREFIPTPSYIAVSSMLANDEDIQVWQYVGDGDWMRIYKARLVVHNSSQPHQPRIPNSVKVDKEPKTTLELDTSHGN